MADDVDVAQELNERFQAQAITHARAVAAAPKQRRKCEHCEENPAEIAGNGVQLRYCGRCRDELSYKRIPALALPHPSMPGAAARGTTTMTPKRFVLHHGKLQAVA